MSKMKKVFGYGESTYEEYGPGRRDIRYVALCSSKAEFVRNIVMSKKGGTSLNWIYERLSETGNPKEVRLANMFPTYLLIVDNRTRELITKHKKNSYC